MMGDLDWDDLEADSGVRQADEASVPVPDEADEADEDQDINHEEADEDQDIDHAEEARLARIRLHAAKMRATVQKNRDKKKSEKQKAKQAESLVQLRKKGLLRDGGKASVATDGCIVVHGNSETRQKVGYHEMPAMAFSKINRVADAARACGHDVRTVESTVILGAHCIEEGDREFCKRLQDDFRNEPPGVFCVGISQDCTTQQVNLPMVGLEDFPELCRSSFHVMVSSQQISWAPRATGVSVSSRCPLLFCYFHFCFLF